MDKICRDIFKAIHEGKWLSIEYKNKEQNTTHYWIGIKSVSVPKRMLTVEGFHLNQHTLRELNIFIDSIKSSGILEGTYYPINRKLTEDIRFHPEKYQTVFNHISNLKILNYLIDCNRLDTTPYKSEYGLISRLDQDSFAGGVCRLDERQFDEIVRDFQMKAADRSEKSRLRIRRLAMNVMSIHTRQGIYVLAYRKMLLNVESRCLVPEKEITVCREFTISGERQSIRKFLDVEDYELLDEFGKNAELIKDRVTENNRQFQGVDDMPYLIAMESQIHVDLNREYKGILEMYRKDEATIPVKAFFGDLLNRPDRRKEYPITLLNTRVNLDQLLAIHNGMKYPVTYIQGPPGTGKTNTIVNTIATAFFNEKTVLFTSYNNHPIDSVFHTMSHIQYSRGEVPFPIIRLGNQEKNAEAVLYIRQIYERVKQIKIFANTLQKNRDDKSERMKQLTELLKRHEEILDLKEREATLEKLIQSNSQLTFTAELQGSQLYQVRERLKRIGTVTDSQALELLTDDSQEFMKYLFYTSANYIQRLNEPKNEDLRRIIYLEDKEMRLAEFEKYLKSTEKLKKFLRIFPIVAVTCISACKLGEPGPHFDMTIMDEASQCNTAIGMVPVIRGKSLMLVGDPQQLNPVILLDPKDNQELRHNYGVAKEYDYITNSIYKAFLASDSVSDEILLSYHYRCNKKIIDFNNKKYYNNKLHIMTQSKSKEPLIFVEMGDNCSAVKNTAPAEAEMILNLVMHNRDKKIGVITPFVRQREYVEQLLKEQKVEGVTCGTVHAFQGDEKDVIVFSTALTDQTHSGTYGWLKNNKELINVAVSRAKEQFIVLGSSKNLERLHEADDEDDLFELIEYVKTNGVSKVTAKTNASRALGVKPYSSETEDAFLQNLNHAIDNIFYGGRKCVIHKEVGISHVFMDTKVNPDLFYMGRFDFVVYERQAGGVETPILAIELDGKEHEEDDVVKARDKKKNEICRQHNLELIRIDNSYARRYHHVKEILIQYFEKLNKI